MLSAEKKAQSGNLLGPPQFPDRSKNFVTGIERSIQVHSVVKKKGLF